MAWILRLNRAHVGAPLQIETLNNSITQLVVFKLMRELVYPTLDLFVYDLKEALNTTDEFTRKNQEIFIRKLPQNVAIIDSDRESEYLELLPQKTEDFKTDKVEGYYFPVRLNDVYGLQVDCSVNNQTEPQPVECFSLLKSEIESRLNEQPITLGQAWMLSGWLPKDSPQNPKSVAQNCYQAFCKDGNWQRDYQGEGTIFGGNVFYLWQPYYSIRDLADSSHDLPLENRPILIAIYPNVESAQKAAEFYPDWMGLFCYYTKINWAYAQSRLIKKNIFDYYKRIERDRQMITLQNNKPISSQFTESKLNLDKIQQDIKQYSSDVLGLAFQKQIIDINFTNYQTRLEMIRQRLDSDSQLDFLNKFSDLVTQKYIVQIDKDSENMQLGFQLLEDDINAVRSRIELTKAERDRSFQEFVAIVGAGVAGASFAPADKNCQPIFSRTAVICKVPVLFSLLVFVIVAGLTWLLRRQWKGSP
ncbi:hypothetical protein MC7420_454 [Coleofasciculus chthonoplastes PCC 7420]|uniref:Uncharacterized protein n=1 Tax=Coleofasciculus chthonoplastes PCC 7420 TaxID=118168 RepID=B4VLP0_9CYAN|nr:hypothetical protein [Coleofasciculus chthonoplastes]EDX77317.1 hypothetical protein MC7420_454 [Coleofasciculus chthonoplastes PCC 7420]